MSLKKNQEYAGFFIRFGAKILDLLIIFFSFIVIQGIFMALFGFENFLATPSMMYSFGFLLFFGLVFYDIYFIKVKGATPGMQVLGIKVVRVDETEITWAVSLVRKIMYNIGINVMLIGVLLILFDKNKQGLHDMVAKTYVVKA